MPTITAQIQEFDKTAIVGATVTYDDGVTQEQFITNVSGIATGNMTLLAPLTITVEALGFQNYKHEVLTTNDIIEDWQLTMFNQVPILLKEYGQKPLVNLNPSNPTNIYYD